MRYKLIKLVFLLFLIAGCNRQNENNFWFLEKDKNYNRVETRFKEYIDFFPTRGSANSINDTWSLNPHNEFNIKIVFEFDDDLFYQTLSRFKDSSIAQYESNEQCLLVLNRFGTNTNYGYPSESEINKDLIDLDCYKDLFPIPNFSNFSAYQTDRTSCKLNEDFIIYVLEAKSGEFLEKENLTKAKYMPDQWAHGYSKGVAINEIEKIIIYWVIIW